MNKMFKIWNKRTCYEIYFRPLPDTSKVEVITYFSGEPFVNPRSKRDDKDNDGNTEVWNIQEARDEWDMWVEYGEYEVSEVEDYLKGGRVNSRGESINYRKRKSTQEQKTNWFISNTKSETLYHKSKRMMKE